MRKRHLIFILLLTSVMITSCMTTRSTSKIQQVQVGMNKTVIKKMLGKPYYRHGDEMGEQWEYEKEVVDAADTVMPPSSDSLYGDISTSGFYLLGIKGLYLFSAYRFRMDYKLYFFSFPSYYWGVLLVRGL